MRSKRGIIAALTMSAVAMLTISACGSSGTAASGSSGGTGSLQSITVGQVGTGTTSAPLYLASAEGIWKKHGLTVKTVTFSGDAALVQAILSHSVDIGVGSLTGVLTARESNEPVKVFYGGLNQTAYSWWALPDIKTVAEGKGKRWGISTTGSTTDAVTRYVIQKAGLNPDKDVKIVAAGLSAPRLAAMKVKQLDVNVFVDPYDAQAKALGYNKVADLTDYVKGYPTHVFWATEDYIAKNPTILKNYTAALSEAITETKANPQLAAKDTQATIKGTVADALEGIQNGLSQIDAGGALPVAADMDVFWDMDLTTNALKTRIPDSDWLDPTYITSAS
jgi:NitT/TauT family transport system substrate-binding protein